MAVTNVCTRCSRISPTDAIYCYYDGAVLEGYGTRGGGPVNIGAQPFPAPFVFPTGQKCLNFDQLALTCQKHWQAALEVLAQGYLEKFLGGMGRSDLAGAARDAARFPDRDRGLDQFLAKLPSVAVQPPRLGVEPTELNLGTIQPGEDRAIDLRLDNKGMRLIYGSIVSDALWLAVGDKGNSNQKLFQFDDTLTIPVKIRGKHVQARNKVQQGKLTLDTNAGKIDVHVKMDVPVRAYADGIFSGAKSPRQLAEKAKEKAKEAAILFESGAVAKWYRDNNWTYPVQGPAASGLGAVQQYFEALGLTPPPRVTIRERSVALRGHVHGSVNHTIELKTEEKRPIYVHGVSDQGWLRVVPAQLAGRTATIQLVVNAVPDQPGTTLKANVTLRSNGNQRFVVPVSLEVAGASASSGFPAAPPSTSVPVPMDAVVAMPPPASRRNFLILAPALALNAALLGVFAYDLLASLVDDKGKPHEFQDSFSGPDYDPQIRLGVSFNERQRFGFINLDEKDPNNPQQQKRLTYMADGSYNNTCVRVDGAEHLYGQAPGDWAKDDKTRRKLNGVEMIRGRKWVSAWEYPGRVRITQTVLVVPNDDTVPAKLNTALIHYLVENRDTVPHKVGLRMMLDTYIGSNDGVPFALPGRADLVTKKIDLTNTKDIPDFIQALERPDLADPGTVATMVLKFPSDFRLTSSDPQLDPITRLVICRFPGNPEVRWDFTKEAFWDMDDKSRGEQNDSCVTLYWPEVIMPAHTKRALAFSYGLGKINGDPGSRGGLALTAPAKPTRGGTFAVTAWVKNPTPGQQVTLEVPAGMSLADAQSETQSVARGNTELAQVSWRVNVAKDTKPDTYTLKARTTGAKASIQVPVRGSSGILFGGLTP